MVYLMSLFLYFNSVKGMNAWYLFELGYKKRKKKKGYIFPYKGKDRKCTARIRLSMKGFI